MALRARNFTLTGGNDRLASTHTPVRQLIIYNTTGNAAVLVGDSTLTAAIFGYSIAAATAGPTLGPFSGELPFNLDEVYVRGTADQVIHYTYLT